MDFLTIFALPECPGGGMVDTLVSGTSASNGVQVRLLSWAQKKKETLSLFFFVPAHPLHSLKGDYGTNRAGR